MEKVLLAILALVLVLCAMLGGITLINERNHEKLMEYVDMFSSENDNSDQLAPELDEHGNWYFTTDEDFKILHLTDIHMTGGPIYFENDKRAINAVAAMINAEDPDLVIITGDISFAYITDLNYNNKRVHELFIRLMDNLDVYWTVTFGNHDTEPYNNYNREEVEALYAQTESEKCLFTPSPEGVSGRGNHVINIKNTSGEITQSLFMFDSHSYVSQDLIGGIVDSIVWNYDNIKQNQVDWYEQMMELYSPKSSLMFFHIPLGEVKEGYYQYIDNGRELGNEVNSFTGHDGENGEVVYSSNVTDNLFETVERLGNTKAMFFGHDHYNNFVMNYRGVIFSYGYSVDYTAYFGIKKEGYQRGCTVLTITPDGEFDESNISHENYYQDKYQPLYEKEVVDMTPHSKE